MSVHIRGASYHSCRYVPQNEFISLSAKGLYSLLRSKEGQWSLIDIKKYTCESEKTLTKYLAELEECNLVIKETIRYGNHFLNLYTTAKPDIL